MLKRYTLPVLLCMFSLSHVDETRALELVYESSSVPTSVGAATFTSLQQGDEVSLAGSARAVELLSVAVTRQGSPGSVDIQARFWANDGPAGVPGTLLWESAVLDDVPLAGGHQFIDIPVPAIVVPDTFTWTVQLSDSKGDNAAAVGLSIATDPAQVGSFNISRFGSTPPLGTTSNQHAALIYAVPEPATAGLLAMGGMIFGRRRRGAA